MRVIVIKKRSIYLFVSIILIIAFILTSAPVTSYVNGLQVSPVINTQEDDRLLQEINTLAHELNKPAQDAYIDPIYKAVPGLNGQEVDIEASWQLAQKLGYVSKEHLYIKETSPQITLDDLMPLPIYKGHPEKNMVSLMVNVAWGTEHLPTMLELFDHYQIKVTFFLDGSWLNKNEQMAKEMLQRGHELSNHAYSHPNMSTLSKHRMKEEIERTEALLKALGVTNTLFAPPSGDYNQQVVEMAHESNLKVVLWSLDTVDWKRPAPEVMVQRIVPKLHQGAMILMHPTASTVEALPAIIEGAFERGLMPGTVSELLSPRRALSVVPQM